MPYGAWDEYFIHQLPRPLDQVSDSEKSWSDRCYFNVHSDDGTSKDVVLQCDSLSSSPIDTVRWLALGPRAEAVVRQLVGAGQP